MSQFKDYLNKIQINESEKKEEDKKDLTSKEKADIAKNAQILSSITEIKYFGNNFSLAVLNRLMTSSTGKSVCC
jgi:hypothetical protein